MAKGVHYGKINLTDEHKPTEMYQAPISESVLRCQGHVDCVGKGSSRKQPEMKPPSRHHAWLLFLSDGRETHHGEEREGK